MTRNDFIQTAYLSIITEDTVTQRGRDKALENAFVAADTLVAAGIQFTSPEGVEFDQAGYDHMLLLISDCLNDGLLKKGMAGPCLLLNEKLTDRLYQIADLPVPTDV